MFTGIIQEVGVVSCIEGEGVKKITVRCTHRFLRRVKRGASIAIDGVCMTLVSRTWRTFSVEAMQETLQKTTFGILRVGHMVNLERSLKVGDEIGGHIVSGHVGGMAEIEGKRMEGETTVISFRVPQHLVPAIQEKGFISLNGASLTVTHWNSAEGIFDVYLIPETLIRTTFSKKYVGDFVNIETWEGSFHG